MKPKLMLSAGSNEKHAIHTKNDNVEIMITDSESFENFLILPWKDLWKVVVLCLLMSMDCIITSAIR